MILGHSQQSQFYGLAMLLRRNIKHTPIYDLSSRLVGLESRLIDRVCLLPQRTEFSDEAATGNNFKLGGSRPFGLLNQEEPKLKATPKAN